MFQATKEGIQDTGLNILTVPYLGPAKLKSAEVKKVGSVDNCIQFTFDLEGEDIKGNDVSSLDHQHVEWAPNDNDTEDQKQNKINRIGYIANRIVPQEKVVGIQATTWVEYCKAIIALLEQYDYTKKDLIIKVLGDVYKDKARVKFPGYLSFISTPDGKALTFSASEQKKNREYMEAVGAKPTPSGAGEDGVDLADVDEASF